MCGEAENLCSLRGNQGAFDLVLDSQCLSVLPESLEGFVSAPAPVSFQTGHTED